MTMYECKNQNGIGVDANYLDVEFAKKQEYPICIYDKDDNCIELKKEEVLWLSEHLRKVYDEMFE
jgi:hypothetical protein